MSNVNVVEEMVTMIIAQRAYEINSKSIQTSDDMLSRVNQLEEIVYVLFSEILYLVLFLPAFLSADVNRFLEPISLKPKTHFQDAIYGIRLYSHFIF